MERNVDWHLKHPLAPGSPLEKRLMWHMEHARRCPCPPHDENLREELEKRYRGRHQDFWILFNRNDHRALGAWAADCAERILPYFERNHAHDARPRKAIETLRDWVKTGEFNMHIIREASLSAHAAAKTVDAHDDASRFAAHAAGQAVATAHVPTHAIGVVTYGLRAVAAAHPGIDDDSAAWQARMIDHAPLRLRGWLLEWLERLKGVTRRKP